jgi:hypothetical protein
MNKGVVGGTPATARGTRAIPQDFVLGGVARNFKNGEEMHVGGIWWLILDCA